MDEFIRGPLVWISFIVFGGGILLRLIWTIRLAQKDKVILPYISLKYSLRSLMHWVVPFANTKTRRRPVMTIITFAFHLCAIVTPIFLLSHNLLWYQSWNIRWWSLPENIADIMTVIVICSCLFCLARRVILPEVKYITASADHFLLAIVMTPFLTGFLAYHQWLSYEPTLVAHILAGEIMLITIPFTRLSHMLFFFFTRAYMGSEFGAVRNSRDW